MGYVDPVYAESILDKMRAMLKKRGADGVRGLGRNFRICDTDGSGQLNLEEMAKCFNLCKLSLKPSEVETLFDYFDTGDEGLVSFEEFIRAVRGKMSKTRKALVVKVFKALDAAGDSSGMLTIDDIRPAFNAADHPDVKAETKTEAQVLQEFLDAFEGSQGNRDGTVTLDEFVQYYGDLSAGIDEDDMFGTMIANSWSALKARGPSGEEVPAIQYVSEGDMDVLERILMKNVYQKSQGVNEERTLKAAFKQFDTDGSGEVSFREFALAMERFGLSVQKPNARSKGGVPPEVLRGLFDRYNADQSEALSYLEFSNGLFKKEEAPTEEQGPNEQGGQNPWLPSLAGRVSMDKGYSRPNTAQRMRSLANPAKNRFTLD